MTLFYILRLSRKLSMIIHVILFIFYVCISLLRLNLFTFTFLTWIFVHQAWKKLMVLYGSSV